MVVRDCLLRLVLYTPRGRMPGFDDLAVEDEEKRRSLVADGPIELEQYFGAPVADGHAFHSKRPWRVAVGRLDMRLQAQPA